MSTTSISVFSLAREAHPLWRKAAGSPDESEVMFQNFGALRSDTSYFKVPTFVDRVSEQVHLIGLRQIALLVAHILDMIVAACRSMGILSQPTFPDHPVKICLRGLGAPDEVLNKPSLVIQYERRTDIRGPNFFRENRDHVTNEVQINP